MRSPSDWRPPEESPSQAKQNERLFAIGDSEEVVLQQSRFWARSITWTLMGVTAFALGWLAFAKTEEIVTAPGKLEPLGVVKEIRLPVGGVVDDILVKEGQTVKKGQVLMRLDTEATRDRQQSLLSSIAFKQQQLLLKVEEMRRYLDVNDTEQRMLMRSFALEQEVLDRLEMLNRDGATSELQYLTQRNKVVGAGHKFLVNKPADISIDSCPSSDFGVIRGRVRRIGSDSLPPDQLKNFYRVPVDIALDTQTLRLKDGTRLPLQVGMTITANVKLRKVTYLQLLLSDFKNKADALRRI